MEIALIIYLLIINLTGYFTMGQDKARAKRKKRRVPEVRLFEIALLGGALGVLIGMNRFCHKTLHTSFRFGIPLLLVLNAAIVGYLFRIMSLG
ncbi:MAG: DUF1294 domain-containing protein [Gorillibacterium sp.]|nr:DUF1294 domain-containing protein [Gorillibacterium sp.]